ncbi:fusarubin cluster-transcription factor [Fusarium longipes]|uniref:Fusarubin cluster-transcription factor n=1 Tax=Fusarium longipes TaxID=694270 RepID=A0A395T715_9HYPO|nr:fusarubin cluster-transcription factor [Fusarium longipes]
MSGDYRMFSELLTPPARSAKPVRLRLACDACTTAKVRCSRTHPCERCEDNGQEKECYYGVSRRHGKQARHRKTVSTSIETQTQTQDSSSRNTVAATPTFTTSGFDFEFSDLAWEDYCASGCSALSDFEVLDGMSSHIDVTVDFDDLNCTSWVDPWMSLGLGSDSSSGSSVVSPDLNLYPGPILSAKPTITPIDMHNEASHDCEAMALRLLRSLHCDDRTTELCKQAHSNRTSHPPSIDTILSVNKAALANLIPLLRCSCGRNPHITMLHSAILSKVVFWYGVASRHHTEGALKPIKIQLGILDLDDEDQATLQRTLLLRELRKAGKVMDTFDSCHDTDYKAASWYVSVVRGMREELQAIIQRVDNGQGGPA